MLMFTLAIYCLHFQFALIHGPDIPDSYAILLFIAPDLASITSHIHSWVFLRNLYAGQEAAVRTGHGITDWFQIGEGIYCHPAYLTYMQSTS